MPSTPSLTLFLSLQLHKLLLAFHQQQVLKVHLLVVLVSKLREEVFAEFDVEFKVCALSSRLHKDDLHHLLQDRRCELEVIHYPLAHILKVALGKLIEEDSDFSDSIVEFVGLSHVLVAPGRIWVHLAFLNVREIEETHISRAVFVRGSQR